MKEKFCNHLSRKDVNETLKEIITLIKSDYEVLKKELDLIAEILRKMEIYSLAYLTSNMAKKSIANLDLTYKCDTLEKITASIRNLGKGYRKEFLQNIEFGDIVSFILSNESETDIVIAICEAKKILNVIAYQIERIYKEKDSYKQIAILKGMIAMY